MIKRIISITLRAMALAMSVAVIVMRILGTLNVETAVPLLAIGLAALGLEALQKEAGASVNIS